MRKRFLESVAKLRAASRSAGLQACQRPPGSPEGLRYVQFCNTLLFITGATLSAAAFAASSAFAAQAPTAAPAGDVAKGKAIFERTGCYQCHGLQGQGGREGPRVASPVPLAWPALSRFVRTTKGDMPPYPESVLSNQELADIYAYMRSIPPAPDFKTIPMLNGMMTTAPAQR